MVREQKNEPALVLPWAEWLPLAWDLGRGSYVQGRGFLGELCNEPKPKLSETIFSRNRLALEVPVPG